METQERPVTPFVPPLQAQKESGLIKKSASKYRLKLLLLFGSRVDGTASPESDFDVAYLASRDLDLNREARLIVELAPVFRSENIDLVNLKKAPPLLFYAITARCRVIYEKDPLMFPTMRAYAFKKYVETRPLREMEYQRLKASLKP